MIKYIVAGILAIAVSQPALSQNTSKDTKKAAPAKSQPAKPKNDPKWKENSMSKKQAECKANPQLAKCKKPAKKDAKK